MHFDLLEPSFVTVVFNKPLCFFTVKNQYSDTCFFRQFEEPVKRFSFNLIIPDTYKIYPDNVQSILFSEPKKMIKEITMPTPDTYPTIEPEIIYDETFNGVAKTYPAKNLIVLGNKFDTLPQFARIYSLNHEIGHLYYNTQTKPDTKENREQCEINADLFALYHFCKQGFNPSSAIYAQTKYLSNCQENNDRILAQYGNVLKYEC